MDDRQDPRVARTRRRTLAAALELLGEHGLEGTTMERVADCAGVHKTTIYRHWPEREELFVEVLTQHMTPPEPPDTGNVRADVLTMMRGFVATISSPPWSVILPSLIAAAASDPRLERLHAAFVEQRRAATAGVLRRGVAAQQLRADLDVDLAVDLLIGPLLYRRLMTHQDSPPDYLHKVIATVLNPVA